MCAGAAAADEQAGAGDGGRTVEGAGGGEGRALGQSRRCALHPFSQSPQTQLPSKARSRITAEGAGRSGGHASGQPCRRAWFFL